MSIVKKPAVVSTAAQAKAVSDFIQAAPDAKAPRLMRGKKEQISLGVAPELLERVDRRAHLMGVSRAAWISSAIFTRLEQEEGGRS